MGLMDEMVDWDRYPDKGTGMTIVCFLGTVGSGKSTSVEAFVKAHPNDPCVKFSPGRMLRDAIGSNYFNTIDGNAPKVCDEYVFSGFLGAMRLARAINYPQIVADGWPRNGLQAAALIEWIHRCDHEVRVNVYHLLCGEQEWERRLKTKRWADDPSLEALDRRRYAASLSDSLAAVAMLRSAGYPFVTIQSVPEGSKI